MYRNLQITPPAVCFALLLGGAPLPTILWSRGEEQRACTGHRAAGSPGQGHSTSRGVRREECCLRGAWHVFLGRKSPSAGEGGSSVPALFGEGPLHLGLSSVLLRTLAGHRGRRRCGCPGAEEAETGSPSVLTQLCRALASKLPLVNPQRGASPSHPPTLPRRPWKGLFCLRIASPYWTGGHALPARAPAPTGPGVLVVTLPMGRLQA